jgi:cytochrome c biogenesis protein CcmG/thiol:disulfide interchange protein DsbE
MNRKVLLIGALLVLPLVAVLAVAFRFDPRTVDSPLVGKTAPDFSLRSLDGEVYRLSELAGQPVVVNFWSTWCPPCYQEHPVFLEYADRYEGQVQFLGVIYQDETDKIRRYLQQLGSWGPSLVDPEGKVAIAYGVYGPPETFFIDSQGVIREKVMGAVSARVMRDTLESML